MPKSQFTKLVGHVSGIRSHLHKTLANISCRARPTRAALLVAGLVALLFAAFYLFPGQSAQAVDAIGLGLTAFVSFAIYYGMPDGQLTKKIALPNGAATVYSPSVDIQMGPKSNKTGIQLRISAPVLNAAQCPDGKTIKYTLQAATVQDFSDAVDYHRDAITQTGANGAGTDKAQKLIGLHDTCSQYLRLKIVGSASGDASEAIAKFEVLAIDC